MKERLEDAQARLRAARKALREDEERAERCREQARQQRATALALRGQMAATQIYSQHLVQTVQELTRRYEGYIESVRSQAIVAYRNAAEARERSADVSRRAAERRSATVFGRYTTPLVFAFAVVVGLAAVEATASAFAVVVAGAVVMLFASLARESE